MHSSPEIHSQTHDPIKEGNDILPSMSQQVSLNEDNKVRTSLIN